MSLNPLEYTNLACGVWLIWPKDILYIEEVEYELFR